MNSEEIKLKLLKLAVYQTDEDMENMDASNNGLFEEMLRMQQEVLNAFGLPETDRNIKLITFDHLPSGPELDKRMEELKKAATKFLLSPPLSGLKLLEEAREKGLDASEVLPQLKFSRHIYNLFVYNKILLTRKDTADNVYETLKKANEGKILNSLSLLALNKKSGAEEKEIVEWLNRQGVKYLTEYLAHYNAEVKNKELPVSLLQEFYKSITGSNTFETIEKKFDTYARYLMNSLCLVVNNHPYRIVECEFYYYDPAGHPDPCTHNRKEQLNAGTWHFNDFGLELTIGNKTKGIYGGILIRGIRSLVMNDHYISGPSNVLREIFSRFGKILSQGKGLCLREVNRGTMKEKPLVKTTRVGLNKQLAGDYYAKPYRFLAELNIKHKFSEKEKVVRSLLTDRTITEEEAREILGYSVS